MFDPCCIHIFFTMTTYISDALENEPGWVQDGETIVLTVLNPHNEPQKQFHFASLREARAWIFFEFQSNGMVAEKVDEMREEFRDDTWDQEKKKLPEIFQKFCDGIVESKINIDRIDIEAVPTYKFDMDCWLNNNWF